MKRKRKDCEKIIAIQKLLEKHEKFNCDYGRIVGQWSMPDESYKYRQNWFHKTISILLNSFLAIVAPVYVKLKYGAKVVGKEHLKELNGKGAICICNHIDWLDTLFVRQAIGYLRSYHTVAPYNNKKGLGGAVMRHGNVLPFSANLKAMKNLSDEMQRLLDKGKIINFFPEQALWNAYREPRPMKNGAFHYAVKYRVPILPVFCTFERTEKCKIKKLKIHILKPIYADDTLCGRAKVSDFKTKAEIAWKNCYLREYEINEVKISPDISYALDLAEEI